MNIIRTQAVELGTIPAITYKQKLASGGSGLRILRLDQSATAIVTIDRRTGEAAPYGKIDAKLFPDEAIDEAMELTSGLLGWMKLNGRGRRELTRKTINNSEI